MFSNSMFMLVGHCTTFQTLKSNQILQPRVLLFIDFHLEIFFHSDKQKHSFGKMKHQQKQCSVMSC